MLIHLSAFRFSHSEKTDIKASRTDELVFPSNRLSPALWTTQRGLQHERSPGTQVSPREASLALPVCGGQGEPSCARSNELWRSMVSAPASLLYFARSDSSSIPIYLITSLPRIISFAVHRSFWGTPSWVKWPKRRLSRFLTLLPLSRRQFHRHGQHLSRWAIWGGKVIYLGVSDTPAWVVSKANEYARNHGLRQFVVYQALWNAARRDFERWNLRHVRSGRNGYCTVGRSRLRTTQVRKAARAGQRWRTQIRRCHGRRYSGQQRIGRNCYC